MKTYQIVLTEKCNLNCHYCYMEQKNNMMINETFLEYFNTMENECTIDLFGGEPLLNWELVEFITETCLTDSLKRCSAINLYTNGLLLDQEKIDFIKKYKINIFWSYDGLWSEEKINTRQLKLIKTLTNFASVQIGPPNLNLVENYKHFIEDLKVVPTFTVMKDKRWSDSDITRFRYEFRSLCAESSKYLLQGKDYTPKVIFTALKRLIEGVNNKKAYPSCGAGERMESLMPDGEIYPCARFGTEKYKIRQVDFLECKVCDLNHFCDKGCYHQVVKNNGILKEICEIYRIIFNCVIEMNNSMKGNVNWMKLVSEADKEGRCIE